MKKSICLFLALCILLSLCACGKTESADTLAEAEPEMVESWIAETIPAPAYADGWNGMTEEFSLWDGKLFYTTLVDEKPGVVYYDTSSCEWDRIHYDTADLGELSTMRFVSVTESVLWALLINYAIDRDEECYLLRCDLRNGTEAQRVRIPFAPQESSERWRQDFVCVHALSAERALLCDGNYGYAVNAQGELLDTIDLGGRWPAEFCRMDGYLYFRGEKGGLQRLDPEKLTFEEEVEGDSIFHGESENGHMLVVDEKKTMTVCRPGEGSAALFSLSDVAVDEQSLAGARYSETAAGDFYYPYEKGLVHVYRTLIRPQTELKLLVMVEKNELIPDDLQGSCRYLNVIQYFNSTHPDYKIQVTSIVGSKEELQRKMIEVINSDEYDLIDTGVLPEGALDSSLLTDLMPYLENDPGISREDFIPNIFNGMLRDGKLYAAIPYVTLMTWGMRRDMYPGKENWTPDYARQMIENRGGNQAFFWTITPEFMNWLISHYCTAEFVDTEEARCSFDDGRFASWLRLLKEIPYCTEYSADPCLFGIKFELGDNPGFDIKLNVKSEEYIYAGFPGSSGNGSYFSRVGMNAFGYITDDQSNIQIGIMAGSQRKEQAWDFVRVMLQQCNGREIPVLKDRFEERLRSMLRDEEAHGFRISTQEDIDTLRSLVYETDAFVHEDASLLNLINGVISDYMEGRYTAEEAAANLQSRASLYVSEQYG